MSNITALEGLAILDDRLLTASAALIYTVDTGKQLTGLSAIFCNHSTTQNLTIDIYLVRSGDSPTAQGKNHVVDGRLICTKETLEWTCPLGLGAGDKVYANASVTSLVSMTTAGKIMS